MVKRIMKSLLYYLKDNRGFARVTGPLFSMSASGSIGKALTYAVWKGLAYVREWFIPENPKSATQVNVRTALTLVVAYWQVQSAPSKAGWETYAEGTGMSGFNKFMSRAMDQYVIQLTTAVTPTSVSIDAVAPPGETWTWA